MTKFILSIAGGGIRGKIVTRILKHLESELNTPLRDKFDLFAGTSIGSVICSSIVYGKNTAKYTDEVIFNKQNYATILATDFLNKTFGTVGLFPKYSSSKKGMFIDNYFQGIQFYNEEKKVLTVSYDVTNNAPHFFKSWKIDPTISVSDIIDASSAVPGYFSSVKINGLTHVDGGLACNYPDDCAYAEALKLWGTKEEIRILSFGTGEVRRKIKPKSWWGFVKWAVKGKLIDLIFDGSRESVEYKMSQFTKALGHKYFIVNGYIENESMDDISDENIEELEKFADKLWEKYKEDIISFLTTSTEL